LESCPAGIQITIFLCTDLSCDTQETVGETTTDNAGSFVINVADSDAASSRFIVAADLSEVGTGAGAGTATTIYRALAFGRIINNGVAVYLGPSSEAALQLLEEEGLANYSDGRAMGVNDAVTDANPAASFAGDSIAGAAGRARDTASADPIVQARLACPVDCDLDRTTTLAELITAVNRALGHSSQGVCEAADGNGDGTVSIDEMVEGVSSTVGCFTK
jgi:hypothetical protein